MTLEDKKHRLREVLSAADSLLVAYSGGVDSAFLAFEAHQCLGERMLAFLADSSSISRSHLRDAVAFAAENSIPLRVIQTSEIDNPEYVKNDSQRCFHCKDELFRVMAMLKVELRFSHLAYGMNLDDKKDFRPGGKAATEHGVLAPLVDAELTKQDVRNLARAAGLRLWNKPASACLASRIEYGRPVTDEALNQVEAGEEALATFGFQQCRVRHHGELARIEIDRMELERALSIMMLDKITAAFKAIGYKYVALDTEGYRSGSMNQVLTADLISPAALFVARK